MVRGVINMIFLPFCQFFSREKATLLSAFPLSLKLVNSCSSGCLIFNFHLLSLVLVQRVLSKDDGDFMD